MTFKNLLIAEVEGLSRRRPTFIKQLTLRWWLRHVIRLRCIIT